MYVDLSEKIPQNIWGLLRESDDAIELDNSTARIYYNDSSVINDITYYQEVYDNYRGMRTDELEVNVSVNPHNYSTPQTIAPTCISGGYTQEVCESCGYVHKYDYSDALGHSFTETTVAPTCKSQGYCLVTCDRCNYEYKYNFTDVTPHEWDEGRVAKKATYSETGLIVYTCKNCGDTMRSSIPKVNTPTDDEADKAPVNKKIKKINKIHTISKSKTKSLYIYFDPVSDAQNYRIMYRKVGDKKWTYRWTEGKTEYTIKNLRANQLYEFKFAAYKKISGKWQRGDYSTTSRRYYYKQNIKKVTSGKKSFKVTYNKDKNADGYIIYYTTKKSDITALSTAKCKSIKIKNKKTVSKTVKGLKPNKKYYVKVRSYRIKDGKTYYGELSKYKTIKTKS